jgi:NAD(P)-dependent dehydrogenase (short-subunit alcohol dehydrogenase family)
MMVDTTFLDGVLKGQVALVVGGAGRIGEATTQALAAAGATVAVMDYDRERTEAVAGQVSAAGGNAVPILADLREEEACRAAVDTVVSECGGIDILANVAGGMAQHAPWRPLPDWTTAAWDAIMHLNLGYVFWLCRAAIPALTARGGGSIINVASVAGQFGSPNQSAYGAAKAGLIQLTQTLAVECGPASIRVNAVSPGVTLAPAAQAALGPANETWSTVTPLRRLGYPEDIARVVLFFASPLSEHVSGQVLAVEGGISSNFPYPGLGSERSN